MKKTRVGPFLIGPKEPLTFLSGPCVIESEQMALDAAAKLQEIFAPFPFQLIFKASYDKANRSSIQSFRGPGLEKGLQILQKIEKELSLPVVTDVHTPEEALLVGNVLSMIQIPAFLSRQTDLIAAAGQSKAAVNVKKGQFLSPWEMRHIVDKLHSVGKEDILLTDRGTSFGYNNLVTDFRSIPIMQSFHHPACFDASHSVMLPGSLANCSGGERQFIPVLSKAAIAAGCNALFIETHPNPAQAQSDAATVFPFEKLPRLLKDLQILYEAASQCSFDDALSFSSSSS